jgi:hypothetical protein
MSEERSRKERQTLRPLACVVNLKIKKKLFDKLRVTSSEVRAVRTSVILKEIA